MHSPVLSPEVAGSGHTAWDTGTGLKAQPCSLSSCDSGKGAQILTTAKISTAARLGDSVRTKTRTSNMHLLLKQKVLLSESE